MISNSGLGSDDMPILCILLLIFIISPYAYSQDNPGILTGRNISSIKAVSGTGITEKDIAEECKIRKGDLFSPYAVRACVNSFYRKGLFKDIVIEAYEEEDGVGLRYIFVEKMKLDSIKIKGHTYFSTKRLKSATGLKKGDELTDVRINEVRDRIMDIYISAGFFDVEVETESIYAGKNREVEIAINIDEGARAEIADIVFTGDMLWKDKELKSRMKIHEGYYYDRKTVDSGIKRLEKVYLDKGYLRVFITPPELLYDETKKEVLISIVIEAGPHVEVRFEGIKNMTPKLLKKELLIWEERAFDNAVLDESSDRLTQYYNRRGYYLARVTYSTEKDNDRNVRILFNITEGATFVIKEIEFTGNSYFRDKRLKGYLDIKKDKFLIRDMLEEDVRDIENLYKTSGFLDVKVIPEIIVDEDEKTLSVRINVEEGIQTLMDRIQLKGNETFNSAEILSHIKSREGQPFDEVTVIDDLYSIQSFYVQRGYIYSSVDVKTQFDAARENVTVNYIIAEDQPVYIGSISLSGNSFTKGYVIRRELLIREDEPYSYENILRSKRRLLRLGIFKDVQLEPIKPEAKEYIKDLSLKVEEGYPGTLELGIGYGDVERFRGTSEVSYKNLFGTGREASILLEGSSIEQKYSLGYKEPWVLGYQMDARFNIVDLIEDKISFDRRTLGLITGIDKSFSESVKGSLMYQYEDVKVSDVREEARLTPEDIGKVEVATINPSLIIDRRDDPFNPSKGAFYSIAFREAAKVIGSNLQFAKVNLQGSHFYSPARRLVFALSVRGGVAWSFGESEDVPIFERYFVGGRSTVRGYDQERLGIPDKTIEFDGKTWNPKGGNVMMVINGEIRFPLFKGLGMVAFVDGGNVWRKLEEFEIQDVKSTVGAGMRLNTPVGPLRLDVGCKLDREAGEENCLPHFTLGHAF